jgi:hypothetical protein
MPLKKATQSVINPNICTTDTTQTISATKTFSNLIIGSASLNVLKSGDTMTGPLIVPAGATGFAAPRSSEVVSKSGDTMTGRLIVSANSASELIRVTQTGTGNAILVEDDVNPDSSPFVVTNIGRVGIGTLNPSNKLDVIGDVNVTGVLVCQTLQVNTNTNIPTFTARINGSLDVSLTSSTPTFVGTSVTITRSSHGLLAGDTISIIGQTGNNAVLNGAWVIDSSDTNTFTFTINSTPVGLFTAITATIFAARYKVVFDAASVGPIKIAKDAAGSFTLQFPFTKDVNFIALGNCCNSGSAAGLFQPFGYTTSSFSFKTYTIGTTTQANFTDINIVIY